MTIVAYPTKTLRTILKFSYNVTKILRYRSYPSALERISEKGHSTKPKVKTYPVLLISHKLTISSR